MNNLSEEDRKLLVDLAVIGCEKLCPDNPIRVAITSSCFADLLLAVERYLKGYNEIMGKLKTDPENYKGWGIQIAKLQNELEVYAIMVREKLGNTSRLPQKEK